MNKWLLTILLLSPVAYAQDIKSEHTKKTRLFEQAGQGLYDGSLEVTGKVQADRYFELIGVSTTAITTPSTAHARVYLSSTTHEMLIKFDNGVVVPLGASLGDISAVTAGYGLTGGGTTGAVTLALDGTTTSYIQNSPTLQNVQFYVSSGTIVGLNFSTATGVGLQLIGKTTAGSSDFDNIVSTFAGSIALTTAPISAGPPYGVNVAGMALRRNTTEPFSGAGNTYLVRSPSFLFECTQDDNSIPWCFGIGHNKRAFFANPAGKTTYVPVSGVEIENSLAVGASVIGVTTAPANGLLIQGYFLEQGSISFSTSGMGVVGTATNDSANAGIVGEYISSTTAGSVNFPSTGTYGDILSFTLTPGDWDISAIFDYSRGSASWTDVEIGIGTSSGNSSTGLLAGNNQADWANSAGVTTINRLHLVIPPYRVSISASTTYYLKYLADFTVATPTAKARLSARRMR